jgi:hypothetical protein
MNMPNLFPPVVNANTFPLDMTEPVKLFERSRFNYLYKNQEAGTIMGFWEVEDGEEIVGADFDLKPFHELIVVQEGEMVVRVEGFEDQIARPGDVIMIFPDRKTYIRVNGRARAFFIVYGTDPDSLEITMRS